MTVLVTITKFLGISLSYSGKTPFNTQGKKNCVRPILPLKLQYEFEISQRCMVKNLKKSNPNY